MSDGEFYSLVFVRTLLECRALSFPDGVIRGKEWRLWVKAGTNCQTRPNMDRPVTEILTLLYTLSQSVMMANMQSALPAFFRDDHHRLDI